MPYGRMGEKLDCICIGKSSALKGRIKVQGGKNSVLPILAASILTKEKVSIHNCPDIEDVRYTIDLLKMLGCKVFFINNTIEIFPEEVIDTRVSEVYTSKTRSSIVFLGAMLGRLKKTVITKPGGCKIGERPLDIHIKGIRKLNVTVIEDHDDIVAFSDEIRGGEIRLPFPSVGATENIILTAVLAKGTTTIINAAKEPEIVELTEFINSMGGNITGAGTDIIKIEGVEDLGGCEFTVGGDRIVASTYMAAVNVTGGKIVLEGINAKNMSEIIKVFTYSGLKIRVRGEKIYCSRKKKNNINPVSYLDTNPYPGFPTDVQPIITAVLSYSRGISKIKENIFENRFMHVSELKKMGADINIRKGKIAIIYGRDKLYGADLEAFDLRGGAALIVAALGAEGKTKIKGVKYIKRGYENLVKDLALLGADIREETTSEKEEEDK